MVATLCLYMHHFNTLLFWANAQLLAVQSTGITEVEVDLANCPDTMHRSGKIPRQVDSSGLFDLVR